jgi:hypothetical protein
LKNFFTPVGKPAFDTVAPNEFPLHLGPRLFRVVQRINPKAGFGVEARLPEFFNGLLFTIGPAACYFRFRLVG